MTRTEHNADLVLNYLTDAKLDVEKLLPLGITEKISTTLGLPPIIIKNALRDIRKQLGVNTRINSRMETIKDYIYGQNYDLTKRLPYGVSQTVADTLKVKVYHVRNAIHSIRNSISNSPQPKNLSKIPVDTTEQSDFPNVFIEHCIENKLTRQNPNAEVIACNTMANYLVQKLPHGGGGIIFGTPTAFCASSNPNNNMFLTDNLKVAHALDMTTDISPTIVIGTGVNPVKAAIKAHHWKTNNTTHHFNIITDIADRDSFTYYVSKMAEQHKLCKVIIMTSGTWACAPATQRKWKMDLNFKTPSKFLITKYPNLHILAMTTGENGSFHYQIKHLNNGKETVVDP